MARALGIRAPVGRAGFVVVLVALALAACSPYRDIDRRYWESERAQAPKLVALDADRTRWTEDLWARLNEEGITVVPVDRDRSRAGCAPTVDGGCARYRLILVGAGYGTQMRHCIADGYYFDRVRASFYDETEERVLVTVQDEGFSGGCPPAISDMFSTIVAEVDRVWTR